ncbi:MAG: membrane protein insertion efficiency factor YidD [Candidatus Moraniibacteriota bacterium]
MSNFSIFLIKRYQAIISPILYKLGVRCRFYPHCSDYAILAIKQDGWFGGIKKTFCRLRRCNSNNLESCIDFPSVQEWRTEYPRRNDCFK